MKDFLTKERKYENIFLLIISIIACVLSILIFAGKLTVKLANDVSPNALAWVLLILGLVSLILSLRSLLSKKTKKEEK